MEIGKTDKMIGRNMDLKNGYQTIAEYKGGLYTVIELHKLDESKALSPAVIQKRLREGYKASDAILSGCDFKDKFGKKRAPRSKSGKGYPYAGKVYSIRQLLLLPECIVNKGCLTYRLRSGMDVYIAMTTPKGQNHGGYRKKGSRQSSKEVVENKIKKPIYTMKRLKKETQNAEALVEIEEEYIHTEIEQKRIKKIMAVPINKSKCRYTGHKVDMSKLATRSKATVAKLDGAAEYQSYGDGIIIRSGSGKRD